MSSDAMQDRLPASSGKEILEARFGGAFRTAHWFFALSSLIRMSGMLLAAICVLAFAGSLGKGWSAQSTQALGYAVIWLIVSFVAGAVVAFAGHLLNAALVTAINSSPIATDLEKEKLVSEQMSVFTGWVGFRLVYSLNRPKPSIS